MAKIRFTAGRVREFVCPAGKGQAFIWDADLPGLGLRATSGGSSYIFQARINDKSVRITIGNSAAWTLDDARSEARRLHTMIDQGRDPRVVKAEQVKADADRLSTQATEGEPAITAWADYVAARRKKWGVRHADDHQQVARLADGKKEQGILRPLLDLPLSQLSNAHIAAWADRETARRPARARLALSLLQTFLNWCAAQPKYADQVTPDACGQIKRDMPKPRARHDCLQREQLKPWFEAVKNIDNQVISAFLQTALLTGARREELTGLKWSDVDFKWLSLTIRDKAESHGGQDGTRTIPLTPYVSSLLRNLQRLNNTPPNIVHIDRMKQEVKPWKPSPWVFFSRAADSGRLQEPRIAHNQALDKAGLPHLSIHGLRRSFGTLSEWLEVPAGVVAQIQGHKPSATAEKHYRVRPLDLLRMWHVRIEEWVLNEAGIEPPVVDGEALRVVAQNG